MSMFWGIDIKGGIVKYDDISFIQDDAQIEEFVDYLKEDLLQIALGEDILIDVGWRPSFEPSGYFHIVLIKDGDWEKPKIKKRTRHLKALKKALREMIDYQA